MPNYIVRLCHYRMPKVTTSTKDVKTKTLIRQHLQLASRHGCRPEVWREKRIIPGRAATSSAFPKTAPPRRLDESSNLTTFDRAAKTRVAACSDQCVGGATLCRADVRNRQIRYKADARGSLEGTAFRSGDHEFVGLQTQFVIDAGKHLQGPSDVQHLAVWECQHEDALGLGHVTD